MEVSATSTGSVDTVLHDPFLPNSEAGRELQPRHLSIKFEGVKFAYPSRPDVNVSPEKSAGFLWVCGFIGGASAASEATLSS